MPKGKLDLTKLTADATQIATLLAEGYAIKHGKYSQIDHGRVTTCTGVELLVSKETMLSLRSALNSTLDTFESNVREGWKTTVPADLRVALRDGLRLLASPSVSASGEQSQSAIDEAIAILSELETQIPGRAAKGLNALLQLRSQIIEFDQHLCATQIVATGSEYHALLSMLGVTQSPQVTYADDQGPV